jgi:hypothetical protein
MALNDIKILQEQANGSLKETLLTPTTIGAASTSAIPIVPSFVYDGTAETTAFVVGDIPSSYAQYNTDITQLYLGNGVTSVGDYAFSGSFYSPNSLTSVVIPNSVTSIGSGAFEYSSLTSVTIGNSVTSIGDSAFIGNSLTSVTIPNSVTTIGGYAFADNSPLTSLTIGNSVTSIGSYAFRLNSLTSVTIPNSVTSIGSYAFYISSSLATVNCLITKTIIDAATNIFAGTADPLTINARASDGTWTAGTGLSIGGNANVTVAKNL